MSSLLRPRARSLHRDLLATTALALALGIAGTGGARAQAYNAGTGSSAGGTNATAVGPNANGAGDESFAGGYNAIANGLGSIAIGSGTSSQKAGTAQGIINYRDNNGIANPAAGSNGNIATGSNSTSVMPPNEVTTTGAQPSGTAIGARSTVGGAGGVAIGYANTAGTGVYNSTAVGSNNIAGGAYGAAFGYGNLASGRSSLALGTANQALGDIAIALGRQSYAVGDFSFAQGFLASAYGKDALAIGRLSTAGEPGSNGSGSGSTAGNIAIGNNSLASGGNALALGSGAQTSNPNAVAIGAASTALRGTLSGNEAFSGNALTANNSEFSVGSAGFERQITNVAGGVQDTDAVNVRQLRGLGNTLGTTLGSSFDPTTNAYTAPSYSYGGTTYSTVPALTNALDTFALRYDRDSNGNRLASVDLSRGGTIGGGSGVAITGLAPATTNDGAVALSQMPLRYATAGSPTTPNPAIPSNDVTLVGANGGQAVALHNVAPGALTASSTDAVNGSQLYQTNQNVLSLQNNATLVQQDPTTRNITIGPATNGTVVDLTGTQGTRRLTGLSSGVANADAATMGQLRLTAGALGGGAAYDPSTGAFTAPSYAIAGRTYNDVGSALAATDRLGVQYTPDGAGNATPVVDLTRGGALSAVALRGVANGTVAANSTDAVNGGQLYAVDQRATQNATAIQNLNQGVTNGTIGLVQQDPATRDLTVGAGTDGTRVVFSNNSGSARLLTGVAPGNLSATSVDAVNGSQLYQTNQTVASLSSGIQNGTVGLVQQDPATGRITVGAGTNGTLVDLTGTQGARRLTGLADGAANADAATMGQLRSTAGALGGGAAYDPTTGAFTAPSYAIAGRTYSDVGSALAATDRLGVQYVPDAAGNATPVVDLTRGGSLSAVALRGVANGNLAANSTDAVNGGQLYQTNQTVANLSTGIQNGTFGLVQQDPASRRITVGAGTDGTVIDLSNQSGTARTLSGVAAGQIAPASNQAVNGSQIYAANASIANALGGGATVAPDGTLTAPRYVVQGATFNNVGSALGSLDAAVTNINTTGTKYLAVRSTGAPAQAQGMDSVALGPNAVVTADRGVALGAGAVANRAGLNGAKEAFSGLTVASTQGAVSVGDAGAERQITNVAGGTKATDAVNLRQLRAAGGNLAGALGGGSGFADDGTFTAPSYTIAGRQYASVGAALGAVDTYGVKYDVDPATGGRGQSITLAGGDPNQPVMIRNVAAGVLASDAANVGQVAQAKAEAIAYTDAAVAPLQKQMTAFGSQLADLNRQVGEARVEARRGAAIGLAASSLRFDDRPGKLSVAAGGGVWRGETAAAFGIGYSLPDGWGRVNATGVAAGRDFGVGAGASFTLN